MVGEFTPQKLENASHQDLASPPVNQLLSICQQAHHCFRWTHSAPNTQKRAHSGQTPVPGRVLPGKGRGSEKLVFVLEISNAGY